MANETITLTAKIKIDYAPTIAELEKLLSTLKEMQAKQDT